MDIEIPTKYKCEVCASVCLAYISHWVDTRVKDWKYVIKVHPEPKYYLGKKPFCSAECCLKGWQDDKKISVQN